MHESSTIGLSILCLIAKKEHVMRHVIYLLYIQVNGETLWHKIEYVNLQPPPIKRKPGSPKKKWIRDAAENMRDKTQLK